MINHNNKNLSTDKYITSKTPYRYYWERHRNGRGFKPYPLDNQTTVNTRTTLAPEMFDDVKGVIRSRKCKKNRQHNCQKKRYKR